MKRLEYKKITCKNEKEHKTYFKIMRITLFVLSLPITTPLLLINKLGEWAEIINCCIVDFLTKIINNIFKLKYWDECRDLDEWELEELEEKKRKGRK